VTPRREAWRAVAGGLEIRVKAQPRARRSGILGLVAGVDGPRLRVVVKEVPEDGRANRALCALLAEALGLPASRLTVTAGASARDKSVTAGGDPTVLATRMAAILASPK